MRPRDLLLTAGVLGLAAGLGLLLLLGGAGERRTLPRPASPGAVQDAPASPPGDPSADLPDGPAAGLDGGPAAEERSALGAAPAENPDPNGERFEEDALYGRVVAQEDRHAIAGARVLVFPGYGRIETGGGPLAETETDETGGFRLRGLGPRRLYHLHVLAEGRLPFTRRFLTGVDLEVELAPCRRIRGVVLGESSGEPLAGLEVRLEALHYKDGAWSRDEVATTDGDGRFSLGWARLGGVVRLRVGGPGRLETRHEVTVLAGLDTPFELFVPDGPALRAELLSHPDGSPLGELDFEVSGRPFRTDAAGSFELVPAPDRPGASRAELTLTAEGYAATRVRLPLDGLEPPLRFHLARGGRIEGRVTDADGLPLAGVRVRRSGGGALAVPERIGPGETLLGGDREAETDETGAFTLAGLLPRQEPLRLTAWAPGRAAEEIEVGVPAPGATAWVEFRLLKGATLEGTVLVDGVPRAARVRWSGSEREGQTEANDRGGYLLVGVAPGPVELWAEPRGILRKDWRDQRIPVFAADGETLHQDVAVETGALATAGRVIDEDGVPLGGVRVYARAGREEELQGARTDSEPDGSFELPLAPFPGGYRLVARDGARLGGLDGVAAGTRGIELVLPALGRLGLDVRDGLSDEPIPSFEVYWRDDRGAPFRRYARIGGAAAPDAQGVVWLTLPRGSVDLVVGARRAGYPPVLLARARVRAAGEERVETVRLSRGGTLILQFRREKGHKPAQPPGGLAGLYLVTADQFARRSGGGDWYEREIRRGQAVRPRRGRAVLRNLAPGTYAFKRRPEGVRLRPTTFEVVAGEERRVIVRWQKTEKR